MKRLIPTIVIALLTASSCSVYHPQMADIPLISHSGDGHIEANLSLDYLVIPISSEVNISGSYGFNDWLAGQALLSYDFESSGSGQVAVGAYKPIDKFVVEGYLGMGGGLCNSTYKDSDNDSKNDCDGHYIVGFGQVNAGWNDLLNGHLDIGAGLKCGLFVPDITIGGETTDSYTDSQLLLEPQLMIRVGGEHVKVTLRAGLCNLTPLSSDKQTPPYSPVSMALGLNYRF